MPHQGARSNAKCRNSRGGLPTWLPTCPTIRADCQKHIQLVNCSRVDGGADRGAQGPGDKNGEGFAAAGGDDENIVGPQADIFRLSEENLFNIHGDLRVFLPFRRGAEDPGRLRLGGASQPAGQGDGAEDGDGALAAQVEGAGALHIADDVDHARIALGDGDDVVGLDFDVGGGVPAVEDLAHFELGGAELAGGIESSAGKGELAILAAARDGDGGSGSFARSAGHGEDFVEGFAAAKLDDAGGGDGAENGDGLAAEVGDGDGDLRFQHVLFEAGGELGFELLDGEAGGFDPPDERQGDVAVGSDEDGLVGEVETFEGADEDLVVGAEDVAGRGRRRCLGEGNRAKEEREDFHDITFSRSSRSETLASSAWTRSSSSESFEEKPGCGASDPVIGPSDPARMCCKAWRARSETLRAP